MAFLNFNLRAKSLLHCFTVSGAKVLFVGRRKLTIDFMSRVFQKFIIPWTYGTLIKLFCVFPSDNELTQAVEEIYSDLKNNNVVVYVWDDQSNIPRDFHSFENVFNKIPSDPISRSVRSGIKFNEPVCYIYTSGTTGVWSFLSLLN